MSLHATTALVLLLSGLGALLATLCYNWYPAKMLMGNMGTLAIGSIIAAALIGNFEIVKVTAMAVIFLTLPKKLTWHSSSCRTRTCLEGEHVEVP